MTAKKSINIECKRCCNEAANWRAVCASYDCPIHFSHTKGSSVRKIKEFCLQCVPEKSVFGVKACDGKYFDGSICVLLPFRMGKNPNRKKRQLTDVERSAMRLRLAKKPLSGSPTVV